MCMNQQNKRLSKTTFYDVSLGYHEGRERAGKGRGDWSIHCCARKCARNSRAWETRDDCAPAPEQRKRVLYGNQSSLSLPRRTVSSIPSVCGTETGLARPFDEVKSPARTAPDTAQCRANAMRAE